MTLRYPITLKPDDNDTLMVTFPDVPEVVTFGEDETDAAVHAADAIATALMGRITERMDIPTPSPGPGPYAVLSTSDALKVGLYQAMRAQGVDRTDLARRLGCVLPQIDRLLDLSHETKLDALEAALRAVGHDIDLRLVPAA